ncbi:MAG: uridine kinase [Oscillospiraceae bacterium]|nr:uridine kinase [Oscillospiraceae bacterium]
MTVTVDGQSPASLDTATLQACSVLDDLLSGEKPILIAIDGRCGSGKTTLAQSLSRRYAARIFHMDDFYLSFARRDSNWRNIPGGNMDFARLREEVLYPAREGEPVAYRPYRAHTDSWEKTQMLPPCALSILEGTYAHHPATGVEFDLKIFLTCTPMVQRTRLQGREGEKLPQFQTIWIPLEEQYFRAFQIMEHSDYILNT